ILTNDDDLAVVLDGHVVVVGARSNGDDEFAAGAEGRVGGAVGVVAAKLEGSSIVFHEDDDLAVGLCVELADWGTAEVDHPAGAEGRVEAAVGVGAPDLGAVGVGADVGVVEHLAVDLGEDPVYQSGHMPILVYDVQAELDSSGGKKS